MLIAILFGIVVPTTLEVGDGKLFARIEEAVAVSHKGDEIRVYPSNKGYAKTAVLIKNPGITIRAEKGVSIEGEGFEYSGQGSVPRAIFQIDAGANGVTIDGFELRAAHNLSHNGAGIRINAASNVTVKNCKIHDCDMGVMSNGIPGDAHAAENQLIDHCDIYRNGSFADPGFNHNLYLGGTSVTVQFCKIHDSQTGHNLKSRAHFNRIQYNSIYASSNRELDFVDAWDTQRPFSNVLLLGNVIHKDVNAKGNRGVIHFGQERGRRDGTIYIINNEILTPFASSVLNLSTPTGSARLTNNIIDNRLESHPLLAEVLNDAALSNILGECNVISPNYSIMGTAIDGKTLYTDLRATLPGLPSRPIPTFAPAASFYVDGEGKRHNAVPEYQLTTMGWKPTIKQNIGAG